MSWISGITYRFGRLSALLAVLLLGLAMMTVIPANQASANALGVPDSEYNALVALYNSTGGQNWMRNDNWLTNSTPWWGVNVSSGHVVQLFLPNNWLTGQLPPELGNLVNMTSLELTANHLTGSIPAELGNLTNLLTLHLRGNQLVGAIPSSLTNLAQLTATDLAYNGLSATDPDLAAFLATKCQGWNYTQTVPPTNVTARGTGTTLNVSWTPILYTADPGYYEVGVSATPGGPYIFAGATVNKSVSSLSITGLAQNRPQFVVVRTVTQANSNNQSQVTSELSSEVLTNALGIPDSEFNALVALYNNTGGPNWTNNSYWLMNRPGWYGVTVIGGHVTGLSLPRNLLSGTMPPELRNLTSLTNLDLCTNQLTGYVPPELGSLTSLQSLILGANHLTGPIPPELGNLTNLTTLDLSQNRLTFSIPAELGNLIHLRILGMGGNQLMGEIPSSLTNLTQLQYVNGPVGLYYNGLSASDSDLLAFLASRFPGWEYSQTVPPTNVTVHGTTVSWTPILYTNDAGYYEIGVSSTPGGPYIFYPTPSKSASSLYIPPPPTGRPQYVVVRTVTLAHNYNQSDITSEWSSEVLTNALGIPDSEFSALVALYNSTGGPNWKNNGYWLMNRPGWYGVTISGGHVTKLSLPKNQLVGTIPPELGNLPYLQLMDLSINELIGSIPAELGNLTSLQSLILGANHLTGPIPPELGNLTNLIGLDLSQNLLVGSIPVELGNLNNLTGLGLSGNQLMGEIPSSLTNLTKLQPGYGIVGLYYNGLSASDPDLAEFLESKFSYWEQTQTVPPTNVTVHGTTVSWTPILYAVDPGYYEVGVSATPGGPYVFYPTSSKSASSFQIPYSPQGRPQYIVVRTVTLAHHYNQSDITSELSTEVLTNALGIPDSEFNALVALYNSTGGPNWTNNSYWLTNRPGWYGVTISGGHVTRLSLPNNCLIGPIPSELKNLTSLTILELIGNKLTGSIPAELGNLTNLMTLALAGNQLVGTIPSSLVNLTQLTATNLVYNGLSASDPALVVFLAEKSPGWEQTQTVPPTNVTATGSGNLVVSWTPILFTSGSGYYEVGVSSTPGGPYIFYPTPSKSVSSLTIPNLPTNRPQYVVVRTVTLPHSYNKSKITSEMSPEVLTNALGIPDSEFKALVALYNSTGGPNWTRSDYWLKNVPGWYGVVISGGHVIRLSLFNNQLAGPLPAELGNLANLQVLDLYRNRLTGTLPAELGNLTNLQNLRLNGNQLVGAIPSTLTNLMGLTATNLSFNGLWTEETALAAFLADKCPGWEYTQTVPPTNVTAVRSGDLVVSWTRILYTADPGYYEVGVADKIGGPYTFYRTSSKSDSSLTIPGLPADGALCVAVRSVTLINANNQSDITSFLSADVALSLPGKLGPDGSPWSLTGGVVTAVFSDCCYVECPDRSYGIRVIAPAGVTVTPGTVNVTGTLRTNQETGERYIEASNVLWTGAGDVTPLALTNSGLGGADWYYDPATGAGQKGVLEGFGLNNIGLLVRIWGKVVEIEPVTEPAVPTWFRIDDGSGVYVKCAIPAGVSIDPNWINISVTGISSCEKFDGALHRLLRIRVQDDITPFLSLQ